MKVGVGIGTEVIGAPLAPGAFVDAAVQAEADGFPSAWCVHFSRGADGLTMLALAGASTDRIELGVSVVPTYPRHPLALAQQAATVQASMDGRLTLGIGVSHRPVIEGMHGLAYERPAQHMREYLSVLGPMLDGGQVKFKGELFQVDAQVRVPEANPVSIVVAALSPGMLRVAGELSDGVVTWMTGRRTLERDIVPAVTTSAQSSGRRQPRVVVGLPIAVCEGVDAGRQQANDLLSLYGTLPNYQRVLESEGASTPGDIAVVGDEGAVEAQLCDYAAAGATELSSVLLPVGDDPAASVRRTTELLRALGPEL